MKHIKTPVTCAENSAAVWLTGVDGVVFCQLHKDDERAECMRELANRINAYDALADACGVLVAAHNRRLYEAHYTTAEYTEDVEEAAEMALRAISAANELDAE